MRRTHSALVCLYGVCWLFFCPTLRSQTSIIIDHRHTDLTLIPQVWIEQVKTNLRIAYQHTSHGSQLVTGLRALSDGLGAPYTYTSTAGGYNAGVFLNDYGISGADDLGNPNYTAWSTATRTLLNRAGGCNRNVVMWSWCGQADTAPSNIDLYLSQMNALEADFPNIRFVYMTGHLNGTGATGNLHLRNEQIRAYCRANGKILFDFADIESFDPSGKGFLEKNATDGCSYTGGNWALEWLAANPGSVLAQLAVACGSCAHSERLNCVLKGRALWWLLARLAGWSGSGTLPPTVTTTAISGITTTGATSGGKVTSDGGAAVMARGVCWGISANPTTAGSKTTDGMGTGTFTSTLTGLSPNTTCHVRAYATNSVGTSYGSDLTFTTLLLRDDFIGAWPGQGVFYRNSDDGLWVLLETSNASKIVAGDLDGDGIDDFIGLFPNDPGVWTKRSSTMTWQRLDAVTPYWIAVGDMNGDGRKDFIGAWNDGVYYRDSASLHWSLMETSIASQIVAGDLDADGKDDIIGVWPSDPGVWSKHSSDQKWYRLDSITPAWIAVGDMNNDGRPDLLGTWTGSGVYYLDTATKRWVLLETSNASMVVAGDLDGDGADDLIGLFPDDPGVWTKRSTTMTWQRLDALTPTWITVGRMRAAGSPVGMEIQPPTLLDQGPWKGIVEDLAKFGPHGKSCQVTFEENARVGSRLGFEDRRGIMGPGESRLNPVRDDKSTARIRDKK